MCQFYSDSSCVATVPGGTSVHPVIVRILNFARPPNADQFLQGVVGYIPCFTKKLRKLLGLSRVAFTTFKAQIRAGALEASFAPLKAAATSNGLRLFFLAAAGRHG